MKERSRYLGRQEESFKVGVPAQEIFNRLGPVSSETIPDQHGRFVELPGA